MNARVSIIALALGLAVAAPALASDAGYLYGRVLTVDGDEYEGQLRWGDEEAFWDDIFNATKVENENLDYVDDAVLDRMRRNRWGGWQIFNWNRDGGFTHLFAVRFGDLKRIHVRRGEDLIVEFRNGKEMKLGGGSNDVGAQITVLDPTHGQHLIKWNRIRTIEFRETPARLENKLGNPIYGTVTARAGKFTGLIQWDHDECLSIDELDGDTRDGDVSLKFGDIASIRKHRRGALVTLRSGTELYLTGSNDVNRDNRGVVVKVPDFGRVKIGWRDFEEVTFQTAPNSGPGYAQYGNGRELSGTVATRGNRMNGRIVFDLDEAWDFELLHGTMDDSEFLIPFREIARIKPDGRRRAQVELRSGLTIVLEESQDVTRRNDGLLVFTDRQRPTYVAWRDVDEVVFR